VPKSLQIVLLAIGLALSAASANQAADNRDTLNQRARFDLNCTNIQAVELSENTYGVSGCGRRGTYVWSCSGQGVNEKCEWLLNGALQEEPARTPATAQAQGAL
jgi:hypothetical protein